MAGTPALVRTPVEATPCSCVQTTAEAPAVADGGRPEDGVAAEPGGARRLLRFAAIELAIWASLYGAYLTVRSLTIGGTRDAIANASDVVSAERALEVFHGGTLQSALGGLHELLAAYYMAGFTPLVAGVVVWLLMTIAVTATGNHYFLDSLAGIGVALFPLIVPRRTSLPEQCALPLKVAGQEAR